PCRYQIAFAIWKSTCGSSPRSREIRLSYDASASGSDIEEKPSVDFMASSVLPSAPFIVMPSAIDALSGERNTLESGASPATWRSNENANPLDCVISCCSFAVSARGSCRIAAGAVGDLLHATRANSTPSAKIERVIPDRRDRVMGASGGCYQQS